MLISFASLVSGNSQGLVQYSGEAERIFLEGLDHFTSKDFTGAYERFVDIISRYPRSQRTSAATIMGAKSLLSLRRYDESIRLLNTFLSSTRESLYLDDAHFTLGVNYYLTRRYVLSAAELLHVLETSREKALLEKSDSLLGTLIDDHLEDGPVARLLEKASQPRMKFFIGLKLAEKYSTMGRIDQARAVIHPLLQQYPTLSYASSAREFLKKIEKKSTLRVGAVLPLFQESREATERGIGIEILQGMEFAVEEFRGRGAAWVELKVIDSEGEPGKAAHAVMALRTDPEVRAILGPVYSAEVSASARAASDSGLPLISPTANANGLTTGGRSIFQANPDYEIRGRAMARYAVRRLGLQTFMLLAPSDSYGKYLAESFSAEVERIGGRVIAREWYEHGATDMQEQFTRLRNSARLEAAEPLISFARRMPQSEIKTLVAAGVPRRTLDSLLAEKAKVKVSALLGSNGTARADSLGIPTMKELSQPDSLEIPIKNVDGFYLPIASAEEIGIVSSQLAYYNFKTQLLGSGEWYNPDELDANRRYTDRVVFDSDTYVEPTDAGYLKFFDGFYQRTGKRPTKNTLFGYDTASLLLSVIASGAVTRDQIIDALQGQEFQGLHSKIKFNGRRVNSVLTILQFISGEVRKVDEFVVEDE
jgi:ABC-type branched-subunit amino acid transport system substrate-binding protein